jgi:hypothetical protein
MRPAESNIYEIPDIPLQGVLGRTSLQARCRQPLWAAISTTEVCACYIAAGLSRTLCLTRCAGEIQRQFVTVC